MSTGRLLSIYLFCAISACTRHDVFPPDELLFAAALAHAESTFLFQPPVGVRPTVLSLDFSHQDPSPYADPGRYEPHPDDAARRAIASLAIYRECELLPSGWCDMERDSTVVFLTRTFPDARGMRRLGLGVLERTASGRGSALMYNYVLQGEGETWTVVRRDLVLAEN